MYVRVTQLIVFFARLTRTLSVVGRLEVDTARYYNSQSLVFKF